MGPGKKGAQIFLQARLGQEARPFTRLAGQIYRPLVLLSLVCPQSQVMRHLGIIPRIFEVIGISEDGQITCGSKLAYSVSEGVASRIRGDNLSNELGHLETLNEDKLDSILKRFLKDLKENKLAYQFPSTNIEQSEILVGAAIQITEA
ncbi:unnamed protein product [Dovyalis caffra]|uniref:Uncharacterized protein n=1 Tax=Dovyalis caffra TaxID=77055 RepID=A0AAV1R757_9ROSI|nr:unnamed protein product [Dovyalis caffra]